MANLKDVAKRAGVSVGTVSRYINGMNIKDKNKEKIEEAIKFLDFRVNMIARTLKTNRTNTVGIVIPHLNDIYSTTIIKSVEEELYKYGYNIFVCDSQNVVEIEREKILILLEKMVDGLILYPVEEDLSYLREMISSKTPCVVLDYKVKNFDCDKITVDNISVTREATEQLIKNHHRKIGIITGHPGRYTADQRLKGYQEALTKNKLPVIQEYISASGFSEEDGYDAVINFLQLNDPPTAVIACNYYTTIGAVKAFHQRDIKIPEQLSFIGYDSIGISQIIRPSLSIVVQPMEEMGREAARVLYKRMKGENEEYHSDIELKAYFLQKDSIRMIEK